MTPTITDQNVADAIESFRDKGFYSIADVCNKALEIALSEQDNDSAERLAAIRNLENNPYERI